ncbi:MAG TPA: hypothetical protein VNV41_07580 [Candidatus Acidoferrales bacterium]|jgi:hypothetical protein|nr:hypothetical protein [Candidatus Acidoferrales bacterium]
MSRERPLSVIVRRDGTPFPSAAFLVHFADGAARASFIEERGQDLDLAGHQVWHEQEAREPHIVWEYWKAGFERSYHGEPSVVELGEIE